MKYLELNDVIKFIDEPNRQICFRFLEENKELLEKSKGSKTKHQAWEGGYLDHVCETMNIAILLFESFKSTKREIPFLLSEALLVLFLHDTEKPWKQSQNHLFKLENNAGIKNE